MDEVQAVESVLLVLDSTVQVGATRGASVSLDQSLLIDDLELPRLGQYRHLVARNNANDREHRAGWFPALGAQAWLNATCAPILTSTGSTAHRQRNAPPSKPSLPFLTPASTVG